MNLSQVKPENASRMAPPDWTPASRLETYSFMAKHVPGFKLVIHNWKYLLTCKTCRKRGSPGSLQLLTKTINRAACLLLGQQSSQVAVSFNSLQRKPQIYQIHEDLFQQACCGSKWVSPIPTCQGSSCNLQAERNCFPGRHFFLATGKAPLQSPYFLIILHSGLC